MNQKCNKTNRITKIVCRMISILMVFCVLNPFVNGFGLINVQAKTKSESVTTSVNKLFKGFKDTNVKTINTYVKSWKTTNDVNLKDLNTYPNLAKYVKTSNKKMTYKIVSKKVKKNTATVKVKARIVNSYRLADYVTKKIDKDAKDGLLYQEIIELPQDQQVQYIVDYLDGCFKEGSESITITKYKTSYVTIKMVKSSNKWKVIDGNDKLQNIMLADYPDAFEKAGSGINPNDYK